MTCDEVVHDELVHVCPVDVGGLELGDPLLLREFAGLLREAHPRDETVDVSQGATTAAKSTPERSTTL